MSTVGELAPMTPDQQELRAYLLGHVDLGNVTKAVNIVIAEALDRFNGLGLPDSEAPLRVIDSLVARPLVARALIETAAEWWADRSKVPLDEARRVITSFMLEPPPGLRQHSYDDRVGGHA